MARMSDRGQTLLVGAIGLAVLFVTMALVLNSAIYGSTLASQGSAEVTGGQTMLLQESVEGDVEYVVSNAIEEHPGEYDPSGTNDQEEFVQDNVTMLDRSYGRYYANSGQIVGLRNVEFTDGQEITESSIASGTNVQVVSDTRVRAFTVSISSLSGPFQILIDEPGGTWEIGLSTSGGETVVTVTSPSGSSESCRDSSGPQTWVNVTAATVEDDATEIPNDHCHALDFFERVDDPYSVQFNNGGNANGKFRLVAKETTTGLSVGSWISPDPAIYAANTTVSVRSQSGTYENQIRAAPGEPT